MKLTKKECEIAVNSISNFINENCDSDDVCTMHDLKNKLNTIDELINEHFDNPPLKFEALTFSKPYWYEEENCWCFLTSINKDIKTGVGILLEGRFPTMKAINFKENHFFAREVKEDV